jgi:hypothetical protein
MMMPSRQYRLFAMALIASLLGACSSSPPLSSTTGTTASTTPTPFTATGVTKTVVEAVMYPLDKTVYWGAWVAVAYLVTDPWAPNWEIQEARFPENHVHFSMTMKRYYTGGAGEARLVFNRRAKELMRAGGFGGYEVVEYSEGMESSVLGAQRTAEGVVRLTKKPG